MQRIKWRKDKEMDESSFPFILLKIKKDNFGRDLGRIEKGYIWVTEIAGRKRES